MNTSAFVVLVSILAKGALGASCNSKTGSDAKKGSAEWSYDGAHGPTHWGSSYTVCNGQKQSPIDIPKIETKAGSFSPWNLAAYDGPTVDFTMTNNGHTVQLNPGGNFMISGGGLPMEYKLVQFHFHWGKNSAEGSEHTINKRMFPLELHLVHFRNNETDIAAAISKPNGLAVLGVLYEVSGEENSSPVLAEILKSLNQVKSPETTVTLTAKLPLKSLLPDNRADFYRYSGSLTTPGCYESVIWTVFKETIKISESQLAMFRKLESCHGAIAENFRPVQSLNGRVVYETNQPASGEVGLASRLFLIPLAMIILQLQLPFL